MEAISRYPIFVGMTIYSYLKNGIKDKNGRNIHKIAMELFILALFLWISLKLEKLFTRYLFHPLFNRLFGDNEQLRMELKQREDEMKRLMEQQPQNQTPQLQIPDVEERK
jgi:hypothetical protein